MPQIAQMPASRPKTHARRYDVRDRSRHSWTHASEQKVRRRPLTTPLHQRHMVPETSLQRAPGTGIAPIPWEQEELWRTTIADRTGGCSDTKEKASCGARKTTTTSPAAASGAAGTTTTTGATPGTAVAASSAAATPAATVNWGRIAAATT